MKYYTLTEAATFLGKSTRTLKRWLKSGKLIPEKTGDTHSTFGPRLVTFFSEEQLRLVTKSILDWFEVDSNIYNENNIPDKVVSCNDKLTKTVFSLSSDEYFDVLKNGKSVSVTEIIARGKKIQTHFTLKGGGLAALKCPFNEYDRAIFDVCNSAREAGLIGLTRDSLFRVLAGGKNRNTRPTPNQVTAIFDSLKRLMTVIEIDFSHTRDKMPKYKEIPDKIISPILPCRILHNVLFNGNRTTLIRFTDESPLMKIARVKKQIITFPVSLRDVTNQNNTPLVIMIKSYIIRRVLEIVLHKMTPTITFDDLLKHCELSNATRRQKQDVRKTALGVMENLQSEGFIKSFSLTKKGDSYYGLSITF